MYCGLAVVGRLFVGGTTGILSRSGALVVSHVTDLAINGQRGASFSLQAVIAPSAAANAIITAMTMDTVASSSSVAIPKSVNMLGVANTLYANGPVTGTFTGSNMATAFAANWTGPATTNVLCYRDALTFAAGATGVVNQYTGYNFGGCPSSATANCTEVVALRVMGNLNGKGINTVIRAREQTSGTINAVLFLESNNPTCGSGIVAGTAADTCLYRGAAGVWTFNNGTSLRVPQYACVGCTSAPTNTAQGDFTSTRVYQAGVQVIDTLTAGTGISISGTGNSRTISATGTAGVTSLTGTANQISVSASTGAVTLSTPNPFEHNQAAPTVNSYGTAIGTAGNLGTILGSNNAFWVTITTGSAPSAGGLIARLDWATAWTTVTAVNGPACRVTITNPEGLSDPADFMSTYGPKIYAIPTSGSVLTSVDLKIATGASAVALPAVTSFEVLVTCNLVK